MDKKRRKKKKAISEIAIVVLLVLIAIFAVLIFWMMLKNFLKDSDENFVYDNSARLEIKKVKFSGSNESSSMFISVYRKSGSGNVTTLRFKFKSPAGEAFFNESSRIPKEFEEITYNYSIMEKFGGNLSLGGDVNNNGIVDITDLYLGSQCWNNVVTPGTCMDINIDGKVNIFDLQLMAANWGVSQPYESVSIYPVITTRKGKEIYSGSHTYRLKK